MLFPDFLRNYYPNGAGYFDGTLLIGRVGSACQLLMAHLMSPIQSGMTMETLQKQIPCNYHVNVSVILDTVTDIGNYPFVL